VITGDNHRGATKGRAARLQTPPHMAKLKKPGFLRHNIKHLT